MNEWMSEWMNEWANEWMSEWMNEWTNERMKEWMNERMKKWTNELTSERMSGRLDEMVDIIDYFLLLFRQWRARQRFEGNSSISTGNSISTTRRNHGKDSRNSRQNETET